MTLQSEKPELEVRKTELLKQEEDLKIQLAKLEESLLQVELSHAYFMLQLNCKFDPVLKVVYVISCKWCNTRHFDICCVDSVASLQLLICFFSIVSNFCFLINQDSLFWNFFKIKKKKNVKIQLNFTAWIVCHSLWFSVTGTSRSLRYLCAMALLSVTCFSYLSSQKEMSSFHFT